MITPETILLQVYQEELLWYTKALFLAKQLPAHEAEGDHPCLHDLVGALNEIARIDEQITKTRSDWLQANKIPGPRLGQVLSEIGKCILEIQQSLKTVERNLVHQQTVRKPELEAMARRKQLQRVYLDISDPSGI